MQYLNASDLLPCMQSGFRPRHSTETAVLRVLDDILQAVNCGDVAALVLLDLSAAFDTVDHSIFLKRLNTTFGISATTHSWFRSYLSSRSQCVHRGSMRSSISRLLCRVPQCSVLGRILFIMYVVDLVHLIQDHGLSAHQYAHDTQVYGACRPANVNALSFQITSCVDSVASWMKSNTLQLNADKTEVMWCTTGHADRRPANSVTIFCRSVPVTSDPPRHPNVHISDARRLVGTQPTALRKCCAGWSATIPPQPSPVGSQCCGTTDLWTERHRPHHGSACQPALAASSTTYSLQGRRARVQGTEQVGTTVLGTTGSYSRFAGTTTTSFHRLQHTRHPAFQIDNDRQPCFPSRRFPHLE